MDIRGLYAGIHAFGQANATLFGSTIMVSGHTVVISENGNVMVDYNTVGKKNDEPLAILDNVLEAIQ